MEEGDLPLMSNIADIFVNHFTLQLMCDLNGKSFSGNMTIFANIRNKSPDNETQLLAGKEKIINQAGPDHDNKQNIKLILDSYDINIKSVEELTLKDKDCVKLLEDKDFFKLEKKLSNHHPTSCYSTTLLKFDVEKWCIKIYKEKRKPIENKPLNLDVKETNSPNVLIVRISYCTDPNGASLKWLMDQSNRPCVITPASWINNRSFFPAQDVPLASATWGAVIEVESPLTVLMAADLSWTEEFNGRKLFHFQSTNALPPSTVAIAVGHWEKTVVDYPVEHRTTTYDDKISCNIYATSDLVPLASQQLDDYLPVCVRAMGEMLGPLPYPRIDLLVVPKAFASLGLTSPNLIFISQTLLCKDGSTNVRIAHELSHYWFGLCIGASNWSEEWLSEGFATFIEDQLHGVALNMEEKKLEEYCQLRALSRYHTLKSELENTNTDIQVLSTAAGKMTEGTEQISYVKNGLNPEKTFTQVHYLKGYFLLKHLACIIGKNKFLSFLKIYTKTFSGQQVSSQDFFNLLFLHHGDELRDAGLSPDTLFQTWLESSGMPQEIDEMFNEECLRGNSLYNEAVKQSERWMKFDNNILKQKRKRKRSQNDDYDAILPECVEFQFADQLVLMLQRLVECARLQYRTLDSLQQVYDMSQQNPDVRHLWCELVVKHKYSKAYQDVRLLLINDQSMGVYLYGEMMLSGCRVQQGLARDCFKEISHDMEPATYTTVHSMLYGTPGT
ncbi:unnamed protein product [Owenia fusiformis]|uniref:Peptidase M1 leukotriene A4 hydrolase/aminopeptidase C-terminal domain-containing protein n=1 Tax=Owenia fusiformis TaxID=6347 RepID=A0A8S4P656_OWEFU|nr:unnamed protein product [Owenia fusiformis]